jgi:hypothetical protein
MAKTTLTRNPIPKFSKKLISLLGLKDYERIRHRFVCEHLHVFLLQFRHLKTRRTAKSYAETKRLNAALLVLLVLHVLHVLLVLHVFLVFLL